MLKTFLTTLLVVNAVNFSSAQAEESKAAAKSPAGNMDQGSPTSKSMHQDMETAMQKMRRNMMSVKMSGNSDVEFVRMMVPHHQGAIDMAQAYLKVGKDQKIREMAQKIITDQQREIKDMEIWLKSSDKESAH